MSTEKTNKYFAKVISEYEKDIQKAKDISKRNEAGEPVTKEEINWLCETLSFRTSQAESSLYDH